MLFSLALHGALRTASDELQPGEHLFAFLDDVYMVTPKRRAVPLARLVATEMHEHAGVEPKLGKFQAWAKGGRVEPPGLEDFLSLRPDEARPRVPIWKGNLPAAQNGIVVLGTPIGPPEFVQRFLQQRLAVQDSILHRLRQVPDT